MRLPDVTEKCGSAWRSPLPSEEKLQENPGWRATLCNWVFLVPDAHPIWDGYLLSLCSLREVPGAGPVVRQFPGAEFEIVVAALNPSHPFPDVSSSDAFDPRPLFPLNLQYQFAGIAEDKAIEIAGLLVRAFIAGHLNPDTDFRRETVRSLDQTIAECKAGKRL